MTLFYLKINNWKAICQRNLICSFFPVCLFVLEVGRWIRPNEVYETRRKIVSDGSQFLVRQRRCFCQRGVRVGEDESFLLLFVQLGIHRGDLDELTAEFHLVHGNPQDRPEHSFCPLE